MTALERIQRQLRELPPDKQEAVADFVEYLSARHRRHTGEGYAALLDYVGKLKGSPNLNEDPVALQRGLRDEW